MRLNITTRGYKIKPQKHEVAKVQEQLKNNIQDLSKRQFAQLVGKEGYAFKSSLLREGGAKNIDFQQASMIVLDFDNGLTDEQFLNKSRELGLEPSLMYHTLSHNPNGVHKFRAIWFLENVITNKEEKDLLQLKIMSIFPESDKSCKDTSRLYYGGLNIFFFNENNTLNIDIVNKLAKDIKVKEKHTVKVTQSNKSIDKSIDCQLLQDFMAGEILEHNEIFHLSCNLQGVKGYDELLSSTIQNNPYNNKQNKINTLDAVLRYGYAKSECANNCKYYSQCKKNHIQLTSQAQVNEIENYAKYESKKLEVKQYLKEQLDEVIDLLDLKNQYNRKNSLMIAQTGSGKTYTTINILKNKKVMNYLEKTNQKVCFIVPNAVQVAQIEKKYNVQGAYGDNVNANEVFEKNTLSAYTWDKFGQISEDLSTTIVILDEVHQIYQDMYRKQKIDRMVMNLHKCNKRIDITATPNKLNFDKYDYILEFVPQITTNYNVTVYNGVNETEIVNIINNSKKFSLLRNDKEYLKYYASKTNKKTGLVTSETKNETLYQQIINESNIADYEGVLNTSALIAGVDINDEDVTDIIIVNEKDIATIKQYSARFRGLKEVNLHIFAPFKNDKTQTYLIEQDVAKRSELAKQSCQLYNHTRLITQNDYTKTLPTAVDTLRYLGIVDIEGRYLVDGVGIRNQAYSTYYNTCGLENFVELLGEYFSNVQIKRTEKEDAEEVKEAKQESKEQKTEYIERIREHKDMLPYMLPVYNGKEIKCDEYTVEEIKETIDQNCLEDVIQDKKIQKLSKKYVELQEEGFESDLAFELALMNGRNNNKFNNIVKYIAYRNAVSQGVKFENTIDVTIHNVITSMIKVGDTVSKEKYQEIQKVLENDFKITLKEKQVASYVNAIYFIEVKSISKKNRVYKVTSFHNTETIVKTFELNNLTNQVQNHINAQKGLYNKANNGIIYLDRKLILV